MAMVSLWGGKRLTPLGVSALALLAERDMHPYEMYQTLMSRREDIVVKVRPGSLYHTVNRLAESDLVAAIGTDREGNRPERTTYRITRIGRFALRAEVGTLLADPINEYPAFGVAVAQAHNLPRNQVASHLRRRVTVLCEEAAELRAALGDLADTPRGWLLDIEYLAAMRDAEIDWINRLLTDLEAGIAGWHDDPADDDENAQSDEH